jgi:hypothetical protein
MPINIKNKISVDLTDKEVEEIVKEYIAKQLDRQVTEITVVFNVETRQEGMQWDPYTVTRFTGAKASLK